VPRSAVLPADNKFVLFTVKNGKAVRHEVKVGLTSGDLVEVIADDLTVGDAVVTLGNYELDDGMAIQAPGENKP
jgi:membrane fusion protein (multidrug efflux system)